MKLTFRNLKVEQLKELLARYKFVLIMIAAGVGLLLWPFGKEKQADAEVKEGILGGQEDFSVEALQEQLSEILSKVEGAGDVSVMLTVRSGMERVLAANREENEQDSEWELREEIVVISGEGGEEAILIRQNYPTFQGALVVCPGGDDPEVRLNITRALSALTGLSSSRITVCKGLP